MAINELVGEIYEAALEEERWPNVIEKLCKFIGADCGAIVFHDRHNRQRNRFGSFGVKVGVSQVYVEQFIDIDMDDARQHLLAAPESEVFSFYWDKVEFARNVIEHDAGEHKTQKDLATLIEENGKTISRIAAKLLSTPNIFAVVQVSRSGMQNLRKFSEEETGRMQIVTPLILHVHVVYITS